MNFVLWKCQNTIHKSRETNVINSQIPIITHLNNSQQSAILVHETPFSFKNILKFVTTAS